tara:strand:+ start:246 stop:551 length:306 start_codon:yes stop_codon:yes gene_type:complete
MAKIGTAYREVKRQRMVKRDIEKRNALKAKVKDMSLSFEERMAARDALNKLPANGSKVRLNRRCALTGRPHGVYRKFGLCRIKLRDMASRGELPGVTKSSW